MVHDALDVLEHAKATPAAHRRLRQMRSDCLASCLKSAQQLLKAHAHGQSGRFAEAIAGHHGLLRLHLKAWGCPSHA